jgi:hypothetical protein
MFLETPLTTPIPGRIEANPRADWNWFLSHQISVTIELLDSREGRSDPFVWCTWID